MLFGFGLHWCIGAPLAETQITQTFKPLLKMAALRRYMPEAKDEDWRLWEAGQRVQIIKNDGKGGGELKFGTEVVTSADGSIAALPGASPGASTAVSIMLELLARCFPEKWNAAPWRSSLARLIPSRS